VSSHQQFYETVQLAEYYEVSEEWINEINRMIDELLAKEKHEQSDALAIG